MTSFRRGGTVLAVAALLSSAVLAGTASAEHRPWSVLILQVASADGASMLRLECGPAGGSHPDPKAACAQVSAADGDFDRLPGAPQLVACPMVYRPVVASVRGSWEGTRVWWARTFGNDCTMHAGTGAVFDF